MMEEEESKTNWMPRAVRVREKLSFPQVALSSGGFCRRGGSGFEVNPNRNCRNCCSQAAARSSSNWIQSNMDSKRLARSSSKASGGGAESADSHYPTLCASAAAWIWSARELSLL